MFGIVCDDILTSDVAFLLFIIISIDLSISLELVSGDVGYNNKK